MQSGEAIKLLLFKTFIAQVSGEDNPYGFTLDPTDAENHVPQIPLHGEGTTDHVRDRPTAALPQSDSSPPALRC